MEARIIRAAFLVAIVSSTVSPATVSSASGASHRTANFIVQAPTEQLAREFGEAAEGFRRDLALEWLGRELPRWGQPCPISTQVSPQLGAGGATTFYFDRGKSGTMEVFGWRMTVQGSRERILDSVLPHEVTHTIFATHFRRPLPRWADEGACTSVEHISERSKQHQMLIRFLKTGQGIPFDRMFAMKEYPRNVMPLYSQGYSSVRFLIAQGGKRKFIKFMEDGFASDNFPTSVRKHYGYHDLGVLQNKWLAWVRVGSPRRIPATSQGKPELATAEPKARPVPNLIARGDKPAPAANIRQVAATADRAGWYSRNQPRGKQHEGNQPAGNQPQTLPARHEAVRPQPIQPSRQIILEWSRSGPVASKSDGSILNTSRATGTIRR